VDKEENPMTPFRDGQYLPRTDKQRDALRRCIALLRQIQEKRQKEKPAPPDVGERETPQA
jgi:hypothetical protein